MNGIEKMIRRTEEVSYVKTEKGNEERRAEKERRVNEENKM